MVGQYLPQTNKKCYRALQCFFGATVFFKGTKHSREQRRWNHGGINGRGFVTSHTLPSLSPPRHHLPLSNLFVLAPAASVGALRRRRGKIGIIGRAGPPDASTHESRRCLAHPPSAVLSAAATRNLSAAAGARRDDGDKGVVRPASIGSASAGHGSDVTPRRSWGVFYRATGWPRLLVWSIPCCSKGLGLHMSTGGM